MLTLDTALKYMGIDYADDLIIQNVERSMATAERIMQGAIGDDVRALLPDDPRVDELVLIYTDDLYSQRGLSAKVSGATRRLVQSMVLQLRLELRQLREAAEVSGS